MMAPESSSELEETRGALLHLAHGRTGSIPAELLVEHVIAVTDGGDWPLRRSALEALLRRMSFGRRDGLRVSGRPERRALGVYETLRKGAGGRGGNGPTARPYRSLLTGLSPLAGSCDCADYQRSGLGLCKHLLAVLEELAGKPRRWAAGEREQGARLSGPRLVWDPVRPLTGPGDFLERVALHVGANGATLSGPARVIQERFTPVPAGPWPLADSHAADPAGRLETVEALRRFLSAEGRRSGASALPSDPALAPLLEDEAVRLGRRLELEPLAAEPLAALDGFKRVLYPYQLEGIHRVLEAGAHLLADDMGLGKTVQAIAVCHALASQGRIRRGLLLVPAALKTQWQREWQACTDVPVTVVDGSPAERAALYRKARRGGGFLIANYEQVLRDLGLMHKLAPDLVVLDEAQRIKNWAAKTSAYVKQLRPRYRLVLTGTPMENRLDELASIMDWVDDRAIEPKWRLAPWHTTTADGKKTITGARNLSTLRTRLGPVMTRRIRKEVLDQLPERTDTRIPVPMTQAQAEAHEDLAQPIVQLMRRAEKRPLTQAEFLRLMQLLTTQRIICNGMALAGFASIWPSLRGGQRPSPELLARLDTPKLLELRELLGQVVVEQGRKVVVFSQWRRMLRLAEWAVSDLLAEARAKAVFFSGEEGQRRRTQNIVDFHDEPDTRVLLCTDAGGVGLNLQRAASCTVNLDLPWNPAVLEQRIGRIYRLGQKHPIDVYYLVSEAGIEGRIDGLIGAKQALFTGLFDGGSDEVCFDRSGSFLDGLRRIIEPVEVPELEDDAEEASEQDVTPPGPVDPDLPAPAEVDLPARADLGEPAAAPLDQTPAGMPSAAAVRALMSSLSVDRTEGGGIVIAAPPETAATLASLFSGMAELLAAAAPR